MKFLTKSFTDVGSNLHIGKITKNRDEDEDELMKTGNDIPANTAELELLIKERISMLNQLLSQVSKEASVLPDGKLHVSTRGKYKVYYKRTEASDKTGEYIPRDNRQLAVDLAQREYDEKLIIELKRQIRHLEQLLPVSLDSIEDYISSSKLDLVIPQILPIEEYINLWESKEYNPRSFEGTKTEYYTLKGERVRSKSEILIANTLFELRVPYRYEYPHEIAGLGKYHPDFTCLNVRSRKEIIWEHFGKMSDGSYSENTAYKINKLTDTGYRLGREFIFTMESEAVPLNTKIVENLVREYLL